MKWKRGKMVRHTYCIRLNRQLRTKPNSENECVYMRRVIIQMTIAKEMNIVLFNKWQIRSYKIQLNRRQ